MEITQRLKEIIKQETNTDINTKTRKRETIEMRSLYCTVLKELKPKKTLQAIGDTIDLNHATVIHSLKNYKIYEQYNPELKRIKNNVLSFFIDVEPIPEETDIEKLQKEILKLKVDNHYLSQIEKPTFKYNIIESLNNLLIDTEDTIQHTLIVDRLKAFYRMNKDIKL